MAPDGFDPELGKALEEPERKAWRMHECLVDVQHPERAVEVDGEAGHRNDEKLDSEPPECFLELPCAILVAADGGPECRHLWCQLGKRAALHQPRARNCSQDGHAKRGDRTRNTL